MDVSTDKTIEIRDGESLCGVYHYDGPANSFFKSFFRCLRTPGGKKVLAPVPGDHPHHHGLQFGLCASDVNFWEENKKQEPDYRQLPIGRQRNTKLERLPPSEGNGFTQQVCWEREGDGAVTFHETRRISVKKASQAYVWTWQTTLTAARDVEIIKSVWDGPGYCGLGLRLIQDLFEGGTVVPRGTGNGSTPTSVTYQGKGAEVRFEQDAQQQNALFVSFYGGNPDFAFMALGPTNNSCRSLKPGERIDGWYVVTVADR
jgi:Family of unknown function (DUF6807)